MELGWQGSLLETGEEPSCGTLSGSAARRRELGDGAWVDVVPGWLRGADTLLATLLAAAPWRQREIRMYERLLPEPRLTCRWELACDEPPHPVLRAMATALGRRYGVAFTQVGANLYRDGADSVAWHGDRVARDLPTAVVALVSLGGPRPLRLRPTGGGTSVAFRPGPGDLLVMGGTCQRTWQHSVPKVRRAAPRVSVQFRHAYPR